MILFSPQLNWIAYCIIQFIVFRNIKVLPMLAGFGNTKNLATVLTVKCKSCTNAKINYGPSIRNEGTNINSISK